MLNFQHDTAGYVDMGKNANGGNFRVSHELSNHREVTKNVNMRDLLLLRQWISASRLLNRQTLYYGGKPRFTSVAL